MMRRFLFHFVFALCCGVFVAVTLRILPESVKLTGLFDFTVFIPRLVAMGITRNPHGGSTGEIIFWAMVFGQAFIVGFGFSFFFRGKRKSQ